MTKEIETPPDFAVIGHPENWEMALEVFQRLRGQDRGPVSMEDARDILPWIPPRPVCRIEIASSTGAIARGVYIDAFLPPDRLSQTSARAHLQRIRQALDCAIREGARVATLGGFTSILLEANSERMPSGPTAFTTGNTLTVAYIVKALERIASHSNKPLADSILLVIGASGDVGSGCARYLAPRVKRLVLCARNIKRLELLESALRREGVHTKATTDPNEFLEDADLVVCAASIPLPSLSLDAARPDAVVCDAGYPRNVLAGSGPRRPRVFFGGMGQVRAGYRMTPDLAGALNPHPIPGVAQGCALEGALLAFEKRWEPFSRGRGFITPARVDEIWALAQRHGLGLAPFFNRDGPCGDLAAAQNCSSDSPLPSLPRSPASASPRENAGPAESN